MRRFQLIALCGLVLAAGCGGSSTQKTAKQLARPIDCRHLVSTTLRSTECVQRHRISSIRGKVELPVHHVSPALHCKVRVEAMFYAANDWLSLADALAKHASPCAQYYISIPPVAGRDGTWTIPQAKQAAIIHRYGPQFHAMNEVRVWAWANWVKKHRGKNWYDAGVLARQRMVTAGYSFKLGDVWAVNEFPITLITDKAQQRAMTDFVRGLYQGGPKQPSRQGLIWRVVPFQDDTAIVDAREDVQAWLEEDSFWRDMSRYVRWWSSEVFAFPTASCAGSLKERTANVTHYLNALVLLAEAGKGKDAVASSFLRQAYSPLENAAWQWTFGFGITTIPAQEMARFVSLQAYATAAFAKRHAKLQMPVRIGFAWAPKNTNGVEKTRFVAGSKQILDQLSTALSSAFTPGGIFPARACGRGGRDCLCKAPGAELNPAWLKFPAWRN